MPVHFLSLFGFSICNFYLNIIIKYDSLLLELAIKNNNDSLISKPMVCNDRKDGKSINA